MIEEPGNLLIRYPLDGGKERRVSLEFVRAGADLFLPSPSKDAPT